jgi:hypothetical protein
MSSTIKNIKKQVIKGERKIEKIASRSLKNTGKSVRELFKTTSEPRSKHYGTPTPKAVEIMQEPHGTRGRGRRRRQNGDHRKIQGTNYVGRETVTQAYGATGFAIVVNEPISPVNTSLCPKLANFAYNFDKYRINSWSIKFKSSAGDQGSTQQEGESVILVVYDVDEAPPSTFVSMVDYDGCVHKKTSKTNEVHFDKRRALSNEFYVYHSGGTAQDQAFESPGLFIVAFTGQPSSSIVIGSIEVSYDITFSIPRANATSLFNMKYQQVNYIPSSVTWNTVASNTNVIRTASQSTGWPLAQVSTGGGANTFQIAFMQPGYYNIDFILHTNSSTSSGTLTTSTTMSGITGNVVPYNNTNLNTKTTATSLTAFHLSSCVVAPDSDIQNSANNDTSNMFYITMNGSDTAFVTAICLSIHCVTNISTSGDQPNLGTKPPSLSARLLEQAVTKVKDSDDELRAHVDLMTKRLAFLENRLSESCLETTYDLPSSSGSTSSTSLSIAPPTRVPTLDQEAALAAKRSYFSSFSK